MQIVIRQEEEHDQNAVTAVIKEAFASAEHSDSTEHHLVNVYVRMPRLSAEL